MKKNKKMIVAIVGGSLAMSKLPSEVQVDAFATIEGKEFHVDLTKTAENAKRLFTKPLEEK